MKQSETDLIIKAMIEANSKITNPKNTAVNPFFKSKYAPLDIILTQIRPILNSCGLVIIQNVSTDERFVSIETGIYHTSGQYIISDKLQMSAEKSTAHRCSSGLEPANRCSWSSGRMLPEPIIRLPYPSVTRTQTGGRPAIPAESRSSGPPENFRRKSPMLPVGRDP